MTKKEDKKWLVRFVVVPIIVVLLGGTVTWFLSVLNSSSSSSEFPDSLSSGLPTNTPKPTVIGTPVDWPYTAVEADIGFTMKANNITFVVDEIEAYQHTSDGISAADGYVFVIVKMRISNENAVMSLWYRDIMLVDGHSNQYLPHHTLGFNLPAIELIEPRQAVAGALVYNVPIVALNTSTKIRFDPNAYNTRFEVFFDPITDIQP